MASLEPADERTPLLNSPHDPEAGITTPATAPTHPPRRHHYLDNLRTLLTILLIFNHIAKSTGSYNTGGGTFMRFERVAMWVFTETTAAFLRCSFYFVSGYSSYLSLSSATPPRYASFWWRKFWKRLLFAMLWYASFNAGVSEPRWHTYNTEGPIYYIQLLFALDLCYTVSHWLTRSMSHRNWTQIQVRLAWRTTGISYVLIVCLFVWTLLFSTFPILPRTIWPYLVSYDTIGPYAPLQFIIAYVLGVHFESIKSSILIRPKHAALVLPSSLFLALASLGIAQHLWPELQEFIRLEPPIYYQPRYPTIGHSGLPKPYNVFYAFWSTFTATTASVSLISLFAHDAAPAWANEDLSPISRHTYTQTYIHSIILNSFWSGFYLDSVYHSTILAVIVFAILDIFGTWICMGVILIVGADLRKVFKCCFRRAPRDNIPEQSGSQTHEPLRT